MTYLLWNQTIETVSNITNPACFTMTLMINEYLCADYLDTTTL